MISRQHDFVLPFCCFCCDDTMIKMARKPVMLQKENPTGCAGEGKQSIGKWVRKNNC